MYVGVVYILKCPDVLAYAHMGDQSRKLGVYFLFMGLWLVLELIYLAETSGQ